MFNNKNAQKPMKQERTTEVNIKMTLHFETRLDAGKTKACGETTTPTDGSERSARGVSEAKIYDQSAISAVRAHLAKYPYGRVESIEKTS